MQRLEVLSKFILALASSVFLFLIGTSAPPIGVLALPFVVQPVLLFGVKFGVAGGFVVLGAALLVLLLFAGKELAVVYGIFAAMAGLVLAALGRIRVIEYLVAGVAAATLALTAGLTYLFYGSWSAVFRDLHEGLTQQMAAAMQMQEKMGMSQESLELLKEQAPQIVDLMVRLLPALLLLAFAFIVLINLLSLGRRHPERREQWLSPLYLREWKAPEPLVWGLIACGFALFVPGMGAFRVVAINFLVLIAACYFAQGLAVIAFFFHKNKVPRFLRGLTYVLIIFQQIFTLLVVGLGLFDLWGDFRRLGKNDLTPSQAS